MKLRFAPSPTGYLHVGNARLAVANYLYARRHGGQFLLRIDDTDETRGKPEYEAAITRDLAWLGLSWDEFARQSERRERYEAAIERLKASGRLYPCFESEEELAAKREARIRAHKPPIYDRAMLRMTSEQRERAEANGKVPYWRFKLSDESVFWHDLVMDDCRVKLTALSDPVLVRADGTVLYTLASVVDDLELGITHVVRGEDHLSNTGVQIDLARALGASADRFTFAHLPLLLDEGGGKLSKRFDALSLKTLRHDGVEPHVLSAYLAAIGSSRDPEVLPMAAQAETYRIEAVSRSAARFDMHQLLSLNRHALHAMSFEDIADRLPEGAGPAFWDGVRGNVDLVSEIAPWWDIVTGEIAPPNLAADAELLARAADLLPPDPWDQETWSRTAWQGFTKTLGEETGRRGKTLFLPLRLALTGEAEGPELHVLLQLLGRERAHARLSRAAGRA